MLSSSKNSYVAVPVATADRPGPWPGVVMIHDAFGLSDDMKEQADWLAAAGFLVVMPDLYEGKAAIRCIKGAFRQLTAQRGPMYAQLERERATLSADDQCTGAVAVIGYCMGGGFALLLAGRPGWSAASINYGMVPENVDEILGGACPVVASFGGRDKALPGATDKVRAALAAGDVAHDVKEYGPAGHGFINRVTVASPLTPLMKVMGAGYHHDSAADAKRRIIAFFDAHLR